MYQAAHAERPHPYKDHDRLVMAAGRFGVFDGAGRSEGSQLAADVFRSHASRRLRRQPELGKTFEAIHQAILHKRSRFVLKAAATAAWEQREFGTTAARGAFRNVKNRGNYIGLTTGTAISFGEADGYADYAYAGDSSLLLLDHSTGELKDYNPNDSQELSNGDSMANGFLGARDYVVQAGRLPLPEAATIMLCTDGINDRRYSGTGSKKGAGQRVTEVRIAAILSGDTSPGDKANALIEASTIPDDASVIIIEHRL